MSHAVETFKVQLGERGRIVLPAKIRRQLNFQPGDSLVLTLESDRCLRLTGLEQVVRESRGAYRTRSPRRSLVDELIAERRNEARHESSG